MHSHPVHQIEARPQWTITYGTCSYQITSDNNIYYVPNDVQPDKQIDTVMYVVCRAMSGKPYQDSGALDAVWGKFSSLAITCWNRTSILFYWRFTDDDTRTGIMDLLNPLKQSGNCNAWSHFFVIAGQLAGGIGTGGPTGANRLVLTSNDANGQDWDGQLWIKNQGLPNTPNSGNEYNHGIYRYLSGVEWTPYSHGKSVNCQGGQQPYLQMFGMHVVTDCYWLLSHKYYDPSYGNTQVNFLDLENEELDGTDLIYASGQHPGDFLRRKSDCPSINFLTIHSTGF